MVSDKVLRDRDLMERAIARFIAVNGDPRDKDRLLAEKEARIAGLENALDNLTTALHFVGHVCGIGPCRLCTARQMTLKVNQKHALSRRIAEAKAEAFEAAAKIARDPKHLRDFAPQTQSRIMNACLERAAEYRSRQNKR